MFPVSIGPFRFLPSVDDLPKPYYIWNFEEDTGSWVNDISNWNQKWDLFKGHMCLHNALPEPKKHAKGMPWLSSKYPKKDKIVKQAKTRLWSPPIPHSVGMHCITMDYIINGNSVHSHFYYFAVLQQQDG